MASKRDNNDDLPVQRLPRGRHKLSRDDIETAQRRRLMRALVQEVAEKGYVATTIGSIVARAAVSRQTFYEQFENKEDCFRAARDVAMGEPFANFLRSLDDGGSVARAGEAVTRFIHDVLDDEQAARCFVLEGPPEWRSGSARSRRRRRVAVALQHHLGLRELSPCMAYSATVDAMLHDALSRGEVDPPQLAGEAVRILHVLVEGFRVSASDDADGPGAADDLSSTLPLLVAAEDRRQAARAALHGWVQALDVYGGCADLLVPGEKALRAVAYVCAGSDDEHLQDQEYALEDYPSTAEALATGAPYSCRVDDPQADPAEVRLLQERGFASLLLVPLICDDGPVGIIELFDTRLRTFSDLERRMAQLLAAHAAALLQRLPSAQLI